MPVTTSEPTPNALFLKFLWWPHFGMLKTRRAFKKMISAWGCGSKMGGIPSSVEEEQEKKEVEG